MVISHLPKGDIGKAPTLSIEEGDNVQIPTFAYCLIHDECCFNNFLRWVIIDVGFLVEDVSGLCVGSWHGSYSFFVGCMLVDKTRIAVAEAVHQSTFQTTHPIKFGWFVAVVIKPCIENIERDMKMMMNMITASTMPAIFKTFLISIMVCPRRLLVEVVVCLPTFQSSVVCSLLRTRLSIV